MTLITNLRTVDADARTPQQRYNASAKGKERRSKYRHDRSKYVTDASYLSRPFVGWDGEGVTRGDRHDYILLANSLGRKIRSVNGLSTAAIFEFLLTAATETDKTAIHVIYGGGYDFNKWLTDLPREAIERIHRSRYVKIGPYRVNWQSGKNFYLSDGSRRIVVYDVVSFFQTSFVNACDAYLGERFADRAMIVAQKAERSTFNVDDLGDIERYNDAELANLVALMDELRERLNAVSLRPRRWDGPGAVATALMMRERVKGARGVVPEPVASAGRYAYAGGRFEPVRFGHVEGAAYEYDVNSAYPYALLSVPALSVGRWEHVSGDPGDAPYALYHVEYHGPPSLDAIPGPLFRRAMDGTVSYPLHVTGWYWSPEVAVAREYCERTGARMRVLEAHVFHEGNAPRPFAFIRDMYEQRRALKAAGNGAHVGIKLGLNSLYGKTAQQVGWETGRDGAAPRIPPYHQLEWAGYVTSHCRAAVLRAALPALPHIIAFETDALFSSAPLELPIGSGLGEWELTEFTSLTYCQSGFYLGRMANGKEIVKTRGIDRGSVTREDVLAALNEERRCDAEKCPCHTGPAVHARLTRFVGAGLALAQDWNRWGRWETSPKVVKLWPQGKRVHYGCDCDEPWHRTVCPHVDHAHSSEFPIEWINPDPAMTELTELRGRTNDEVAWDLMDDMH